MAAPPEKTIHDLTGDWTMNKTVSEDPDAILALQGVSWIARTAISYATIILHVKQYKDDEGNDHIDIEQTATGGFQGTKEMRLLTWTERPHSDTIFGDLRAKSRILKVSELGEETPDEEDRKYLSEGWEDGTEGDHVQSLAISDAMEWTANQIWGFQEIDGTRYHVRKVVVRKGDQVIRQRLVYDFQQS